MACFLVPTAEAIVTTIATKYVKSNEKKIALQKSHTTEKTESETTKSTHRVPFSRKLKWLSNLLWGGSLLLAFEHIWHGEVVPWFPFLTATSNPDDKAEMLHEMATTGVTMALVVTAVWALMLVATNAIEKRTNKIQPATSNIN